MFIILINFSRFCISKKLKCNDVNNCGQDGDGSLDKSDEIDCKNFLFTYERFTFN